MSCCDEMYAAGMSEGRASLRPDREALAEAIAKRFPALLAQYSQFTVADFVLNFLKEAK